MKVLWVVNHYMKDLALELGIKPPISGSWLEELSKALANEKNIELEIVCPSGHGAKNVRINNIHYRLVEMSMYDKMVYPTKKVQHLIDELLDDIKPDIIHLQGSEFAYGLAFLRQKMIPVVISLQGLISEISKKNNYWAGINNLNWFKKFFIPSNLLIYFPELIKYYRNLLRAKAEVKQLHTCDYFIGRTDWDKAHCYYQNPNSTYYPLQETIRKPFFIKKWNMDKIKKNTIFCAGGYGSPLKGAHKVIEAAYLLKKEFSNIQVIIPGKDIFKDKVKYGYKKYLCKLIEKLKMKDQVKFIGVMNETEMAEEFSKCNIYVMGSSIENSSNTMGEAMCVGIPSIISFVGGLPSLANDKQEVLFYQFGDVAQLAYKIRRIFTNEQLALNLSELAKKRGKAQYCKDAIFSQIINVYTQIIDDHSKNIYNDN